MGKKLTHQQYVEKLSKINPNIKVLEAYIGMNNKILHKCECGNDKWIGRPADILKGIRCWECRGNRIGDARTYTHKQYVDLLKIKNPNVKVVEQYLKSDIPIFHECKCGNKNWMARPNDVLDGKHCMECNPVRKKTHSEYIKELSIIRPSVIVLEEYNSNDCAILHQCECGNIWSVVPNSVLNGIRCGKCTGKMQKTTEQFKREVFTLVKNEYDVLGEYVNTYTHVLFMHNSPECNFHKFLVKPNNFLGGTRCPYCNFSKGESEIGKILNEYKVRYEMQYSFKDLTGVNGGCLRFDFAIYDKDVLYCLIEFQGKQHYEFVEGLQNSYDDFTTQQNHDIKKREYCIKNCLRLIEIPYWNQNNLEQILKDELKDLIKI